MVGCKKTHPCYRLIRLAIGVLFVVGVMRFAVGRIRFLLKMSQPAQADFVSGWATLRVLPRRHCKLCRWAVAALRGCDAHSRPHRLGRSLCPFVLNGAEVNKDSPPCSARLDLAIAQQLRSSTSSARHGIVMVLGSYQR
jgi:hypothetical protein